MNDERNPDVKYERRDVNARIILYIILAGFISAIGVHFLMNGIFHAFRTAEDRSDPKTLPMLAKESQEPPDPKVQASPRSDLQKLRAAELTRISTYGWVDQKAGIVYIPIDRAIELALERGVPDWQKENASQKKEASPEKKQ